MNDINYQISSPPVELGNYSKTRALSCKTTIESFEWKKRLIQNAEHNILLSGNYCGGNSFDEIISLIEQQLTEKKSLKVVILSSDKFINKSNRSKIDILKEKFPENFQLIETPDIWHINPGLKKTTNHSKFLITDYGNHFILGGSGLEDKYSYSTGLGDKQLKKPSHEIKGLIGKFLPRGFRDQDFVFSSEPNGVGRRLYIESLKLALRWNGLENSVHFSTEKDLKDHIKMNDTLASKLIMQQFALEAIEDIPGGKEIPEFDSQAIDCRTKILCTGPEHSKNPFEEEIFNRIKNAKQRIRIDHMYFHPTDRIIKELAAAAERGIKITIITNGNVKKSPGAHKVFAPRNRYNYWLLANQIGEKFRKNLNVFEFCVPKTTLHKKVIVIDDCVIAGSSNLGYKSLITMSDHEVNFITEDQDFADKVIETVQEDAFIGNVNEEEPAQVDEKTLRFHATRIEHPEKRPRLSTIFKAAIHRIMAPLYG